MKIFDMITVSKNLYHSLKYFEDQFKLSEHMAKNAPYSTYLHSESPFASKPTEPITAVDAAIYCALSLKRVTDYNQNSVIEPFYILSVSEINSYKIKDTYNLSEHCEELKKYVLNNEHRDVNSIQFKSATAAALGTINRYISSKTLLAYTKNKEYADKYINFEFRTDMSDEEIQVALDAQLLDWDKEPILEKVLGTYYKQLPKKVQTDLTTTKNLTKSIGWKLIKRQMKFDDPINQDAYTVATTVESVAKALNYGNFLEGLDLSNTLQIAFIRVAASAEPTPDGKRIVDELHDENEWHSAVKMRAVYEKYVDIFNDSYGKIKTELDENKKVRIDQANQNYEQKRIAKNAAIDMRLSQLHTELSTVKSQYHLKVITYAEYVAKVGPLESEIKNLTEQKR